MKTSDQTHRRPRLAVVADTHLPTWLNRALTGIGILLLLLWPRITDFYSYNAQYYNGLVAGAAITAILTMSMNLAMGYGGILSLMHTGLQLAGGYAVAHIVVHLTGSWLVGLVISVGVSAAIGALILVVSLRATSLYFSMITLAANLILVEVGREWDPVTGGIIGISGVTPTMGDVVISKDHFYYVVLGFLAAVYLIQRNLIRSGLGRSFMAVRESPETASALTIWPAKTKLLLFTISGGLAGLSGGLFALQLGFVNPDVGLLENGLVVFVGLFLGGIGTLAGPVLGVAAIALVTELIKEQARYSTLILGLILLGSLLLLPKGIVGSWRDNRWHRLRRPNHDLGLSAVPTNVARPLQEMLHPPGQPLTGGTILECRQIVKHFGGVRAVDGVDLRVRPATIHGLIGPNGSGKSTLISCLTRFQQIDSGEIWIRGALAPKTARLVARAGVTRVFQKPHIFEQGSVLDNVLTGFRGHETYSWSGAVLRSPRFRRQEHSSRIEAAALLDFAGLAPWASAPAGSLSHGQRRLLEVVRALATRPALLILDEPATGLTLPEVESLAHLCRTLRDEGIAVLIVEHNVAFIMDICDEITVLESGRVIEQGTPAEVQASPAVRGAYLGSTENETEATDPGAGDRPC